MIKKLLSGIHFDFRSANL